MILISPTAVPVGSLFQISGDTAIYKCVVFYPDDPANKPFFVCPQCAFKAKKDKNKCDLFLCYPVERADRHFVFAKKVDYLSAGG